MVTIPGRVLADTGRNHELPDDEYFLYQIRFQLIAEKAIGIYAQNQHGPSNNMDSLKCSLLQAKLLLNQVFDLKEKIPPYLLEKSTYHLKTSETNFNL